MIYLMKQKLFSWGDDFTIKDDAGNDRFFVDGKAFSLGNQLSFQDMAGNELAYIRQKLLSWGPTYEISRGDQLLAVVHKELFTFFKCTFTVDVPGPDDMVAEAISWIISMLSCAMETSWPKCQSSGSRWAIPTECRSLRARTTC
jgi:uncharacterized protein YxjI